MSKYTTVVGFIKRHLDKRDVSRTHIADLTSLPPNLVSMIITGKSKLPIARVRQFAAAIGADPKELFLTAMREYQPELLEVIDKLYELPSPPVIQQPIESYVPTTSAKKSAAVAETPKISKNDRQLLQAINAASMTPREFRAVMAALRAYSKELSGAE